MTVKAHPLADQLADRWNQLHPEEEEETMSMGIPSITGGNHAPQKASGPRKGLSHLEWAAEDLGLSAGHPCPKCDGTGQISDIRPADIARALTGNSAKSGSGVMLSKVTEDPPLSMVQAVAKRLETSLDGAADWIAKLHKAEVARRNGGTA